MKPIIKIENLNFTYNKGKDNEFHALININLEIYPEEFIIFFGPSGCGKSTLLNVIAGLESPESGDVFVLERDLTKMSKKEFAQYHRRQIGMIYQAYNLITSLSVLDNVALPQIFINVRRGRRNRWAKQLLDRFGILKQANKIPTELSGGQQQRIGIARSIVNNPQIVLADEPVGNLDSVSAKNVFKILTELNENEKKTIIVVTHNPEHLEYGDRIIYLKDGIITHEVINRDKHKKKKEEEKLPKLPSAEIRDLMRAYQGLTPEQINILIMPYKARIFTHHFVSTLTMEETRIFEDAIQRRLMGTISENELLSILDRPFSDGGVGYDKRTAQKVINRINQVIKMAYFVYQKDRQRLNAAGKHDRISADEKTQVVTEYLLKTCYGKYYNKLSEIQINRLRKGVKDRLTNNTQKADFNKLLDESFNKGGIGLNSKSAKSIAEELELIMIMGFGVVQTKMQQTAEAIKAEKAEKDKQITTGQPSEIVQSTGLDAGKSEPEEAKKESQNTTDNNRRVQEAKDIKPFAAQPLTLQDAMAAAQEREEEIKRGNIGGEKKIESEEKAPTEKNQQANAPIKSDVDSIQELEEIAKKYKEDSIEKKAIKEEIKKIKL